MWAERNGRRACDHFWRDARYSKLLHHAAHAAHAEREGRVTMPCEMPSMGSLTEAVFVTTIDAQRSDGRPQGVRSPRT